MNPLTIIKLEASNIKRLKAVTINPKGHVVVITGENDSGKTSTLDSIAYALGGKDLIDAVPIRQGASKAKSVVVLGHDQTPEFKVTRSFSALGGSTLTIEDATGAPVRSPQTLLDKLCSKVAFDPLAFVRMKPAEQLETLRKLVNLDFSQIDAKRKLAYDSRTLANRDLQNAKSRAAEVEVDPETPDEEVSVADLMAELEKIKANNDGIAEKRREVNEIKRKMDASENELLKAEQHVADLKKQLESAEQLVDSGKKVHAYMTRTYNEAKEASDKLIDADESTIRKQIADAGSINAKVRDKKRFAALQKEVKDAEANSEALTAAIEALDKQKSDALAAAKFPLPGLSFDETGVLLNGVPFTQGSQARQLQAAIAIGIAMNPTVRVILVRDASLLDDKSMELVAKMADEHKMQFWLERVSDDAPGAVVIEDGQVKEAE